uniref:Uncharacterized protein n=3 Tax=Guillardia theta TaxID=55529 RepID=A0A7S4KFL5_GUITH|mmetsp:Transcript_2416/g.7456  ORF Transcript_2416/g.7456 Transcript_2416/m.7456 type:complete len:199 (+) Transcript_2416:336-932(+)
MFAIDRRIMDEEIGNWKNQAFLAHHRAGVALRDYRSKMTRSEGQRLTRGKYLEQDSEFPYQDPANPLSLQDDVDDVETASSTRPSRSNYSLSSQDEDPDEQISAKYAESIQVQYLESICYRLHREKAVCMNIIRDLKEKLASAEQEIQKLDSALSMDQSLNSSTSSSIHANGRESNDGKLAALETENEMLRKKIAEVS